MQKIRRTFRAVNALLAGLLCLSGSLLPGCGTDSERRAVSGVLLGAEGRTGQISFIPVTGEVGPAARAAVLDGRYAFSTSDGPGPGQYEVHVELHRVRVPFGGSVTVKEVPVPATAAVDMPPELEAPVILNATVSTAPVQQIDLRLPGSS